MRTRQQKSAAAEKDSLPVQIAEQHAAIIRDALETIKTHDEHRRNQQKNDSKSKKRSKQDPMVEYQSFLFARVAKAIADFARAHGDDVIHITKAFDFMRKLLKYYQRLGEKGFTEIECHVINMIAVTLDHLPRLYEAGSFDNEKFITLVDGITNVLPNDSKHIQSFTVTAKQNAKLHLDWLVESLPTSNANSHSWVREQIEFPRERFIPRGFCWPEVCTSMKEVQCPWCTVECQGSEHSRLVWVLDEDWVPMQVHKTTGSAFEHVKTCFCNLQSQDSQKHVDEVVITSRRMVMKQKDISQAPIVVSKETHTAYGQASSSQGLTQQEPFSTTPYDVDVLEDSAGNMDYEETYVDEERGQDRMSIDGSEGVVDHDADDVHNNIDMEEIEEGQGVGAIEAEQSTIETAEAENDRPRKRMRH
ncbi:hypothetical protein KCU92_g10160, partial [Aureobasidium melanogenum]